MRIRWRQVDDRAVVGRLHGPLDYPELLPLGFVFGPHSFLAYPSRPVVALLERR
jgi:hypothetical protein